MAEISQHEPHELELAELGAILVPKEGGESPAPAERSGQTSVIREAKATDQELLELAEAGLVQEAAADEVNRSIFAALRHSKKDEATPTEPSVLMLSNLANKSQVARIVLKDSTLSEGPLIDLITERAMPIKREDTADGIVLQCPLEPKQSVWLELPGEIKAENLAVPRALLQALAAQAENAKDESTL